MNRRKKEGCKVGKAVRGRPGQNGRWHRGGEREVGKAREGIRVSAAPPTI